MNRHVIKIFPALGTVNMIDIPSCPNESIIRTASSRVLDIHRRFSVFEDTSDISRINAMAGIGYVPVHPDTIYLLEQASRFSKASAGAFDVTIRPLVELWGFGGALTPLPNRNNRRLAKKLVNWEDILLDKANGAVKLCHKGQSIDLGGIAKGYAVDELKRLFTETGVDEAVINLGGSVCVIGPRKNRSGYSIPAGPPAT